MAASESNTPCVPVSRKRRAATNSSRGRSSRWTIVARSTSRATPIESSSRWPKYWSGASTAKYSRASPLSAPPGPTSRASHAASYVSGLSEPMIRTSPGELNHTSTCGKTVRMFRTTPATTGTGT